MPEPNPRAPAASVDERAELGPLADGMPTQSIQRVRDVDDSPEHGEHAASTAVDEQAMRNGETTVLALYPPGGRVVFEEH